MSPKQQCSFNFTARNGRMHVIINKRLSWIQSVPNLGITNCLYFIPHPYKSPCFVRSNKLNITFHRQKSVSMTTSHWCHSEWVSLIELYCLWYPRILLFSSQASTGPFSPGVHLPFCWKQEVKGGHHSSILQTSPGCINPLKYVTDSPASPTMAA